MGIKSASSFGQQGKARQSLLGTLWVTVGEFSEKTSSNGKNYITGKCYVSGAGESFTFFSVWPSQNQPNLVEEFKARYNTGDGAYWLVTAQQNTKDGERDGKPVKNTFTQVQVLSFKDEFDANRDGILTGTVLLNEKDSKYYEARGEKKPMLLLKATVNNTYNGETRELPFEMQAFDDAAEQGFKLLAGDDIVDKTPLFVRVRVVGSRLILAEVKLSAAPSEATEAPAPAPAKKAPASGGGLDAFGGGPAKPKGKKTTADPEAPWEE